MSKKKTIKEFIEQSIDTHGKKYEYTLTEYVNTATKVKLICPDHGTFEVRPNDHLSKGVGCRFCVGVSVNDFIIRATEVHNGRYDYSSVDYTLNSEKVKIVCSEHGTFHQTIWNHLIGCGCPICNLSKGELTVKKYLEDNNIEYHREKTFDGCVDKKHLRFDFCLPNHNICIEYDGIQHYEPSDFYGGEQGFEQTKRRDQIKTQYCKDNNITLIRIRYDEGIDNKLKQILVK